MRIRLLTKLVAAFAAIAVIVGAVAAYIMMESHNVSTHYEQEAIRLYKNHVRLAAIEGQIKSETASARGYLLMQSQDHLDAYRKADAHLKQQLDDVLASTTHPESEAKIKTVIGLRDQYNKNLEGIFTLVQQGKALEARIAAKTTADGIADQMSQLIEELAKVYGDAADRGGTEARAMAEKADLTGMIAIASGLVIALLVGILLARQISRPILRTASLAMEVAAGQLRVQPLDERSKDEVGDLARAFNQMVRSLGTLVSDVTESAKMVTSSAETLAQTSEQASRASGQTSTAITMIASGTSKQAETTASVNETVQQLQQAIEQVAQGATQTSQDVQEAVTTLNRILHEVDALNRNAGQVAAGSRQAAATAKAGSDVVSHTAQGMARIKAAVDASSARIEQLEKVSRQIGEISEVISSIADQTNLLALNAAIEAARAGEHGRGFAVVAEEVRKLAEHSSKSAKEIGGLIGGIQSGTAEVVRAMAVGTAEVNSGHQLADKAGQALAEILGVSEKTAIDVDNMARAVQEIQKAAKLVSDSFESVASVTEENTAATEEMAASAEQVTDALSGIAGISQENASVAEEVSASSEELTASAEEVANSAIQLREIATRLQKQISQFRI